MRIRRSRLTADYVQIPNGTVRDDRLSYMARGILAELLSRPEGWEDTADNMWRRAAETRGSKGEGRRAFRAAFAELKECGYLVAEREQLPGGKHATVLTAYDVPAGDADVPHAGTSEETQTRIAAGDADVPHAGTSDVPDVPHAGTPAPPGQMTIPAGGTDVPLSDVPHAGTSNRRRSKNTEEKTGQQHARSGGIPDRLEPLRTALAAAGLGAVAWDIRKVTDWERIRRQMDRLGVEVMVESAALAASNRGRPDSVTAWIGRWESLADPQPQAEPDQLPAPGGQVVPLNVSRQQQEVDGWADRAMARAKARMQQEGTS